MMYQTTTVCWRNHVAIPACIPRRHQILIQGAWSTADPNDKEFAKEGRPALTGDELINAPGLSFQFLRKASTQKDTMQWRCAACLSVVLACCCLLLPLYKCKVLPMTVRHHALASCAQVGVGVGVLQVTGAG